MDSFYTLYTHLPETGQERPLTHALFVHGFDIPLTDEATFALAAREYGAMISSLGLELLIAKTNLRQMLAGVSWELAHGTALVGAALTLNRAFSRLYIPGTYSADEAHPWGSDYRTDPLLSTRMLEIVHDGADVTRVDKIRAIANWPETFGRLRVCWKKPDGLKNCCRCSKCLRTMITLEMLGALPNYTTFPLPLERRAIRTCRFTVGDFPFMTPILECPEAAHRPDLTADLRLALRISRLRVLVGTILRRLGLRR